MTGKRCLTWSAVTKNLSYEEAVIAIEAESELSLTYLNVLLVEDRLIRLGNRQKKLILK